MIRKIPTKAPLYERAARWIEDFGYLCDDLPWLPVAISVGAIIAVTIFNSIN